MREDRIAKDDFSEAERGSSRLARKFGLLTRVLERNGTGGMQCALRVFLLLVQNIAECFRLLWVW
jgi:hypothetical protein